MASKQRCEWLPSAKLAAQRGGGDLNSYRSGLPTHQTGSSGHLKAWIEAGRTLTGGRETRPPNDWWAEEGAHKNIPERPPATPVIMESATQHLQRKRHIWKKSILEDTLKLIDEKHLAFE